MKNSEVIRVIFVIWTAIFFSGCGYITRGNNAGTPGRALSPEGNEKQERIVTFTAVGKGLVPETAINTGQGKLLAKRAATVDGYRQLVEKIKGVYIDAYSRTSSGFVDYDVIRTKTQSWLRGVEIIDSEEIGHGVVKVNMQIRIYFIQDNMIWWPEGLGSNVVPALFNTGSYFFARPAVPGMARCNTYPWCGSNYYYNCNGYGHR